MWLHAHHGWKCMQAGCQRNSLVKSTGLQKAAQISGFLLGNPAIKLHAIQALNCRPFVI
jgi:hypothetical protein